MNVDHFENAKRTLEGFLAKINKFEDDMKCIEDNTRSDIPIFHPISSLTLSLDAFKEEAQKLIPMLEETKSQPELQDSYPAYLNSLLLKMCQDAKAEVKAEQWWPFQHTLALQFIIPLVRHWLAKGVTKFTFINDVEGYAIIIPLEQYHQCLTIEPFPQCIVNKEVLPTMQMPNPDTQNYENILDDWLFWKDENLFEIRMDEEEQTYEICFHCFSEEIDEDDSEEE